MCLLTPGAPYELPNSAVRPGLRDGLPQVACRSVPVERVSPCPAPLLQVVRWRARTQEHGTGTHASPCPTHPTPRATPTLAGSISHHASERRIGTEIDGRKGDAPSAPPFPTPETVLDGGGGGGARTRPLHAALHPDFRRRKRPEVAIRSTAS